MQKNIYFLQTKNIHTYIYYGLYTPYILGGNKGVQESAQFGPITASALRPKIDWKNS